MKWDWVIARLSEPSTYTGLAAILGGAGMFGLSTGTWGAAGGVAMAVFGLIAAVKKDKGW